MYLKNHINYKPKKREETCITEGSKTLACHKQDDFEEEEEEAIFFYHRR